MPKLLDANAIIRFLINDIPEQAESAANIIYNGAFTKEAVLAEVVYVLNSVYKLERSDIANKTLALLELIDIENSEVVESAITIFSGCSLDFVDCLLIAYNKILGIEIFSFDKKLNNYIAREKK